MLTIGEERTHFGYDAVHDKYVDGTHEMDKLDTFLMLMFWIGFISLILSIVF